MKRLRNTIFIVVLLAIVIVLGFVLLNNTNKRIKIETRDLESITLVSIPMVQGKVITKPADMKAICDLFDATDMEVIENWEDTLGIAGGNTLLFRFNYSSGTIKEVSYSNGTCLKEGDAFYNINSTEFEKFWDLDYPAQRWDFKENQFAETELENSN